MKKRVCIESTFTVRSRYDEVDQMGYVYHANYVKYCHQARTELMRSLGINDKMIEEAGWMMPVLSFNINYKKPAFYDDEIIIKTQILEQPKVRLKFYFEITNADGELLNKANSSVVFVNKKTRKPYPVPDFVLTKLNIE